MRGYGEWNPRVRDSMFDHLLRRRSFPLIPLIHDKCPPQPQGTIALLFLLQHSANVFVTLITHCAGCARFDQCSVLQAHQTYARKRSRENRKRKVAGRGRKFIALLSAGSAYSGYFGRFRLLLLLSRDRESLWMYALVSLQWKFNVSKTYGNEKID